MKLKIHSGVDLITNSSTIIFTYSEGSLSALKDLVDEMLKTFGKIEKFDDVFAADVFLDDIEQYVEYLQNKYPDLDDIDSDYIEQLKQRILIGQEEKPQWMFEVENCNYNWQEYRRSTCLEIIPKDEKYKQLASLLLTYLYSTDHEATRDG